VIGILYTRGLLPAVRFRIQVSPNSSYIYKGNNHNVDVDKTEASYIIMQL